MTLRFKIILIIFIFSHVTQAEVYNANKDILEQYPQPRYIGSGMSLLFGALSIDRGIDIFDKDKPDSDKVAALGLLALGSARFIDGSIYMFKMEPGESAAFNNKIKTIENLSEISKIAYQRRMIRSALMGATSALYLHLYFTGDEDYETLIYPSAALMGVTIFQIINLYPEEQVFQNYKLRSKTLLQFAPLPSGGIAQVVFIF